MSVLYSREFIKVLRQSKVCPRLTSLADCQVDSEKEWKRVRKRERARGENRTHLNFIFVCKFSIGFYAVRLVWKRKLSHRNRNREKKKKLKKKQKYASEWASLGLVLFSLSFWPFVHTVCLDFGMAWTESASESHANAVPPPADSPLPSPYSLATHSVTKQLKQVCNQCTKFLPEHKTLKQQQKQTDKQTNEQKRRTGKLADGRTETDNRHSKRYKTASKLCGCSGCPRRLPPCGCLVGAFDCKQVQTRLKVCGKGAGTRHKQATEFDYDLSNTL